MRNSVTDAEAKYSVAVRDLVAAPTAPIDAHSRASGRGAMSNARRRLELIIELERALANDAKKVVRVASSAHILAGCGEVLQVSQGNKQEYDKSRPADAIPVFVSHSWMESRWEKALALATHLHLWPAFALSVACLLGASVAVVATSRAEVCAASGTAAWLGDVARAATVPVVPGVAFVACVVWGSNLPAIATDCFLDKLCIHQADAALKQQAIDSLDIFLRFSRRLLVLWSPGYLNRLWCTYELATFVKLHPDGASRVDFVPSWMPRFIIGMHVMLVIMMPFLPLLVTGPIFAHSAVALGPYWAYVCPLFFIGILPVMLIGTAILYLKVKEHTEMLSTLRSFRVADAACHDPADVAFLHGLIELMWSSSADDADGLGQFERFVRHELAHQLEAALGARTRLPYGIALVSFLPLLSICVALALVCDANMLRLWGFAPVTPHSGFGPWALRWLTYGVELWGFANPIATVLTQVALARGVDAGWGAGACIAAGTLVYAVVLYPLIALIVATVMYRPGEQGALPELGVELVCFALMAAATAACWNPPRCLRWLVDGGASSSPGLALI